MKTELIVSVHRILIAAKLTKMEDADKFKVIKAMRALKPTAKEFEDFIKDVQEKLKPEDFEEMEAKAQKLNSEGGKANAPGDEFVKLNAYFDEYRKNVEKCAKEAADKDNELIYEKLSEEAFARFLASNDFNVNEILNLQDVLCNP